MEYWYTIYLFKEGYDPRIRMDGPVEEETANENAFSAHEKYPGLAYAMAFSSFSSDKKQVLREWAQAAKDGSKWFDGTHDN